MIIDGMATYFSVERGAHRTGFVADARLYDVADATGDPGDADMLAIVDDLPGVIARLAQSSPTPGLAIESARFAAPLLYPSAICCAGANYTDHLDEMTRRYGMEPEPEPHSVGLLPWHFVKPARTLVGHGAVVTLPSRANQVDWEVELAVVIGRQTKGVRVEDALSSVAGYTVANDLSARDLSKRNPLPLTSPFYHDWFTQKCFDGSTPLGPWIVPTSRIADPQNLEIKLWVNDRLMQDSHTSRMVFSVAEQIAKLSESMTLYPGDVILTGTPAGVGAARDEYLQHGDVVRSWIEGIGTLQYDVVAHERSTAREA